MSIEVFNRYEKKYMLDEETYNKLTLRLLDYMEVDEFNRTNEFYNICNIYYDTEDNYLIQNSINKPVYKEKLRLRSYGVPELSDKVFLEIKKKYNGLVNKRRTKLILSEAYQYIKTGQKPELKPFMNKQVLNEIDYMIKRYKPVPKLYLSYDRKAFFGIENKDFRVTFDTNIRTRRDELFLESGSCGYQLLPKGKWLMEVKIEKGTPMWFTKLLSEYQIYSTSFSKYGTEYKNMVTNNYNIGGQKTCLNQSYHQQQQMQPYQFIPQF